MRWMIAITGLVLTACSSPNENKGGEAMPNLEDGVDLTEATEAFGGLEIDILTIRESLAYAAVWNRTGSPGKLFDVNIAVFAEGEELTFSSAYCHTPEGGATVANDALAHCTFSMSMDVAPDEVEIGFGGSDPVFDWAPEGTSRIDGDPTYGDADSSQGWVEALVCTHDGEPGDVRVNAIVLDEDNMPWDTARGDDELAENGCGVRRVSGLDMPANPVVIAYP